MNELLGAARIQAALQNSRRVYQKIGIVTSYDPERYQARVELQPEGILTGWLPISSQWVGANWGLFMPPSIDQHVKVEFIEASLDAGIITGMQFSDAFPPISVPAGEMLMQHKAGSLLQFHNDGTVHLVSAGTLTSEAPQWNHTGPMKLDGDLDVTGDISDQNGAHGTVRDLRDTYNGHDHNDPQGGVVGIPNQQQT